MSYDDEGNSRIAQRVGGWVGGGGGRREGERDLVEESFLRDARLRVCCSAHRSSMILLVVR